MVLRRRYEVLLTDAESGAQWVHTRRRTVKGATETAERLNLDLYFRYAGLSDYGDTLYFSVRDRKGVQ